MRARICAVVTMLFGALPLAGCGSDAPADPSRFLPDAAASADTGWKDAGHPTPHDDANLTDLVSAADVGAPDSAGVDGSVAPDAGVDATAELPPMTLPAFVVGYNEAWFAMHYGSGLTTDFDLAYADQVFDGIVEGGGKVVRLFLFELLQGITLGTTPPQTQAVSAAMLENLGKVIDAARARGLWVYLTALEGNSMSKVPTTKTYYQNLLNNVQGEGDAFDENVYAPLLAMLDGHQDNVFGLDLVNEIDAPKKDGL